MNILYSAQWKHERRDNRDGPDPTVLAPVPIIRLSAAVALIFAIVGLLDYAADHGAKTRPETNLSNAQRSLR